MKIVYDFNLLLIYCLHRIILLCDVSSVYFILYFNYIA